MMVMPSMKVWLATLLFFGGIVLLSSIVYIDRRATGSAGTARFGRTRLQAKGDTQPDLLSNRQNAEGKVHEPEQKVAGDSHEQQGKGSESSNVKQEPKEQKQGQETSKTDGKQEPKASKADQKEQKASETEQKKPSQQKPKEEKPGSSTGAGTKESGSVKDTVAVPSQEKKATSAPVAKPPANLPLCPQQPPKLVGRLFLNVTIRVSLDDVLKSNPDVKPGGFYSPPDCQPRDKVAIIIPYRDRDQHLHVFLHYMIPILRRQLVQFKIYIIEQAGNCQFNRGMLLNVGALEAAKDSDWQCFALHDIDLILEDDRNLYTCPERPKHMSVAVDKFKYRLLYAALFGGITILTKEQFWKINGYSNMYWGWGGEDDDLYKRVVNSGMKIMRPDANVARYKMIRDTHHTTSKVNPARFDLLRSAVSRMKKDGLNSASYEVTGQQQHSLYTKITVALKDHVKC